MHYFLLACLILLLGALVIFVRWIRYFLLACLTLLLSIYIIWLWLAPETEERATIQTTMQTFTHPNGLILTTDGRFPVMQTQTGYEIDLNKERAVRYPQVIHVELNYGPGPRWTTAFFRLFQPRSNYQIDEDDDQGASGDTAYTLTAWKLCSDKHVLVTESTQAGPFFEYAFQILDNVKCAATPVPPNQELVATLRDAERGDPSAQNKLGEMYANGRGVVRDGALAVEWFRKAADQGNAQAWNNLGEIHRDMWNVRRIWGVRRDDAQAVDWFRKAAEQGFALAQYNLGEMYRGGYGVAKDFAQAVVWYRRAAEQGNADAQNRLGFMFDEGRGVAHDYAQAAEWYRKAADQGNTDAQCSLGEMYRSGRGVLQDDAEALAWYRKAFDQDREAPCSREFRSADLQRARPVNRAKLKLVLSVAGITAIALSLAAFLLRRQKRFRIAVMIATVGVGVAIAVMIAATLVGFATATWETAYMADDPMFRGTLAAERSFAHDQFHPGVMHANGLV